MKSILEFDNSCGVYWSRDIVLCFDKNFINPVLVLLKSLELSNKNEMFDVHIVSPDCNKQDFVNGLRQSVNGTFIKLHFYNIDNSLFKDCPVRPGDHINLSTYYRIMLPTVLPQDLDTVLYLDGDMLISGKISELQEIDLKNYGAAVVPDIHFDNPGEFKRLGLEKNDGYFNAGFMLINLKYWREKDIQNKTLSFIINNPDRCKKHDQDALSYILSGKLLYISHKYNYQRILLTEYFRCPPAIENDVHETAYSPCIIHYCDSEKPWHFECFHPLEEIWHYVARQVPTIKVKHVFKYKGYRRLKFICKQILIKLHLSKPFVVKSWVDYSKVKENIIKILNDNSCVSGGGGGIIM